MTTQKQQGSSMLGAATLITAIAVALFSGGLVQAQTTYTSSNGTMYNVPAGYTNSTVNGTYYNSSTGMYYDASTGQYSTTAPSGTASRDIYGNYVVPAGYTSSMNGTYYDSATGMYYDPATGFYSTNVPGTGSVVTPGTTVTTSGYTIPAGYTNSIYGTYYNPSTGMYYYPTTNTYSSAVPTGYAGSTVVNPGVPDTGAGGEASANFLALALAGLVALSGIGIAIHGMRTAE